MNDRNKSVQKKSKDSKKCKHSSDNDINGDKQMSSSEEQAWTKFTSDNVNDTEWLNNVVGVWD